MIKRQYTKLNCNCFHKVTEQLEKNNQKLTGIYLVETCDKGETQERHLSVRTKKINKSNPVEVLNLRLNNCPWCGTSFKIEEVE